ncbi:MAG: hypothetical protein ACTSU9_07450 [Promethearchaeota archaeon]
MKRVEKRRRVNLGCTIVNINQGEMRDPPSLAEPEPGKSGRYQARLPLEPRVVVSQYVARAGRSKTRRHVSNSSFSVTASRVLEPRW